MLVLHRKPGESIVINGEILVKIIEVSGKIVAVGIEAPKSIPIVRLEVIEKTLPRPEPSAWKYETDKK